MKAGSPAASAVFVFGPFRLDAARAELLRGEEPVPLTPKAFETLRMLAEADGAVVSKEVLLAEVWRDRFVEESVLSQNIYTLRKVLSEGDNGRPYILTVPRRGYRLAVPVERLPPSGGSGVWQAEGAPGEGTGAPTPMPGGWIPSGGLPSPPYGLATPAAGYGAVPQPTPPFGMPPAVHPSGGYAVGTPPFGTTAVSPGAMPASGAQSPPWGMTLPLGPPSGEIPAAAGGRSGVVTAGKPPASWRRRALPWAIAGALVVVAVAAAILLLRPRPAASATASVDSVAVLPFVSLGGEDDGGMLGLAMADALITRLAELDPLVVRPTSAVQEYRDAARDPLAIGRRLGVDAVMDGSLQRAGERLRLSLRLLQVTDGRTLWAGSFETVFTDPFGVQDAISAQVAEGLSLSLSTRRAHRPGNRGTSDVAAYQEYVRGRYFWNRRTEADLRKAIEHFQAALQRDPAFAAAQSGIADSWALLPLYGSVAPREAFPRAIAAARAALDLDPELAEAHTSLAYARFLYDWDWAGAEEGFRKAQRLDPSYPTAAHWHAYLLSALGRHREAIANAEQAQRLDPLSLPINADLGFVHYFARDYPAAIGQFERTLELDSRFAYAHFGLALARAAAGDKEGAVAAARTAVASSGSAVNQATLGYTLALAGRPDEASQVLAELERRNAEQRVQPGAFALLHLGLGQPDEALEWLERAHQERSRFVVFLAVWPIYDPLRSDPRFVEMTRRLGLPTASEPRR